MTELVMEQPLEFGDYLAAIRRRRGLIGLVAGIVFATGLVTAFVWPPTYEASSTILIEEQEIPTELIQSTVTSYASQRIQVISQRVMTRANLMEVINKYELYRDERKRNTIEEILEEMRDDINLNMVTADVLDPRTGRPTAATIAFNVGYQGEDPKLVQKVASELTTLFLNENLRTRTQKATETYEFLTAEANRLKEEIAEHEAALAEFKGKYINSLPESKDLNTQALERYERELQEIDTRLQSAQESRIYIEGQISLMEPYMDSTGIMDPAVRLQALKVEYIRLLSRYSADHPDVAATRREIKALEIETGIVSDTDELVAQLETLRAELSSAEQEYTDEHPDIKNLRRQIAAIESELQNPVANAASSVINNPDNPAFVNLNTQLARTKSEIGSLLERREKTLEKISDYENRLLLTPKIEQEFRTISRDLLNASARYQEILAKQMTAEVGKEMEAERKGEKFTLIDPAILPEEPISPNRPAIIFISLILALGAGIGSALIRENMDNAVRDVKGLVAVLNSAPLAVIPFMVNTRDTQRKSRKRWLTFVIMVAVVVIALLLVHFLVTPLDVMWFKGMRKVNHVISE